MFYRSRINYWSCSKFANWVRGSQKPYSETAEGWTAWRRLVRKTNPTRYWLAEEGLDHLQNVVYFPYDCFREIKYRFNNHFISKTHALTSHKSSLKRGQWCDVSHRMLPCLFDTLVDFVEVELAYHHIWCNPEDRKKYFAPRWAWGKFRLHGWRSAAAGLDNLRWQMNLIYDENWVGPDSDKLGLPTSQSIAAREVMDLYLWYTENYKKRPDVYDITGWSEFCAKKRENHRSDDDSKTHIFSLLADDTSEEKIESRRLSNEIQKIEEFRAQEDTDMLIRLIKVRDSLWT